MKKTTCVTRARLREDFESCTGADVVQLNKQVVEDERHRLVVLELPFKGGQAEREERLVALALAHVLDWDFALAGEDAHDVGLAFGRHGGQSRHAPAAELGEEPACPLQERALMLAPVMLDRTAQRGRCRLKLPVALVAVDDGGARSPLARPRRQPSHRRRRRTARGASLHCGPAHCGPVARRATTAESTVDVGDAAPEAVLLELLEAEVAVEGFGVRVDRVDDDRSASRQRLPVSRTRKLSAAPNRAQQTSPCGRIQQRQAALLLLVRGRLAPR